jgi:UDP-N-acetylmuramate--alanine ligase
MSRHYHFMGIGGIGMSGLAQILLDGGARVSGCDGQLNVLARKLEARGVKVWQGHSAEHIQANTSDAVNVLVTSTAIRESEPEVIAARAAGVKVMKRIDVLGELMHASHGIGVVGTHGKTSTSSMIAAVFEGAGRDPTCVIGGELREIGGNAKFGRGKDFIAEVDESDPNFQFLKPQVAVITNVEDDHISHDANATNNYHASLEALHAAFRRYAENSGVVVYCRDWPGLEEMLAGLSTLSYGMSDGCDYRAINARLDDGGATFGLEVRGVNVGDVRLRVPGEHNLQNSLAALAVGLEAGIDFADIAASLESFRGAGRRWEILGEFRGALVVDDYAHNPTKVLSAIAGALTTGRRVRVVFQPHRYGRTARDWPRYVEALMRAHEVLILDIYAAGETPVPGIHARLIEEKLREAGHGSVLYVADREQVIEHLLRTAEPRDVIVTMGAGDVTSLGRELLERARVLV